MRAISAAYSLFGIFALSWLLAAVWSRRTVRRPMFGAQTGYTLLFLLGIGMLMSIDANPDATSPVPFPGDWALLGGMAVGFAFCWWARIHLGSLWSGSVTAKADHRVVDTGPYRLVRHPIYTGMIAAAFCMAALKLSIIAFAGAAILSLSFWIKARMEERFLRDELGAAAYDAYAARTPMLVPFWPK